MEHPLDSFVGMYNAFFESTLAEFLPRLIQAEILVISKPDDPLFIYMPDDLDGFPCFWVFTKEVHAEWAIQQLTDEGMGPILRKIRCSELLDQVPISQVFTILLNPRRGGSPFQLQIPQDACQLVWHTVHHSPTRKAAAINHLRNIMVLSKEDGYLDPRESEVIGSIKREEGISDRAFEEIFSEKHNRFVLPESWYMRALHLHNYVRLIMADHHAHEKELETVENLAIALQFPEEAVRDLVRAFVDGFRGRRELDPLLGDVWQWARTGFSDEHHWDRS